MIYNKEHNEDERTTIPIVYSTRNKLEALRRRADPDNKIRSWSAFLDELIDMAEENLNDKEEQDGQQNV